jgi:hypothetical protein
MSQSVRSLELIDDVEEDDDEDCPVSIELA